MKIDIITYIDEQRQDLTLMLSDYLNLVAKEVKHYPWRFKINIAEALHFTFKNLHDFTLPKGKIFVAQKSNQAVGTESIKKYALKLLKLNACTLNQNIKETE